jgi:hypothetical protein
MPSTDRKLELKSKTSMDKTASQAAVYAKGLQLFNPALYKKGNLRSCFKKKNLGTW